MNDCISREEAKREIRKRFTSLEDRCELNSIINMLPSVYLMEKTGADEIEKIKDEIEQLVCDEYNTLIAQGLCKALEVIEKHVRGGQNE